MLDFSFTYLLLFVTLAAAPSCLAQHEHHEHGSGHTSLLAVPASLAEEHQEIHERLRRLVNQKGKVGAAARDLEETLAPHFQEENKIPMPVLGALPQILAGTLAEDRKEEVLIKSKQTDESLPRYLDEHKKISAKADALRAAGEETRSAEAQEFSKSLHIHAQTEEQVLYPAAILAGRYLSR